MREIRNRLAHGTSRKPDFECELLCMFARKELSARVALPLLATIFALASTFWAPVLHAAVWLAAVIAMKLIVVAACRALLARPRLEVDVPLWRRRLVWLELANGTAWAGIAAVGLGTADATALQPTELFVLRRREFLPFLESRPLLAIKVIEVLCAKLRHTTRMVEDLMLLGMGARMARALLRLAEEHGKRRGPTVRLDLKLSQRDLGSYVGLSRENVNRQFKVWRELGILAIHDGHIVILDEAALRCVADEGE